MSQVITHKIATLLHMMIFLEDLTMVETSLKLKCGITTPVHQLQFTNAQQMKVTVKVITLISCAPTV